MVIRSKIYPVLQMKQWTKPLSAVVDVAEGILLHMVEMLKEM